MRSSQLVIAAIAILSAIAVAQQPRVQPSTSARLTSGTATHPEFANVSRTLTLKSTGQIANPAAMNSTLLGNLQQQKQAADLESSQILSASAGTPAGSAARRPGPLLAAQPAPPPPKHGVGEATAPTSICMTGVTGIQAVNQKKSGVVFTPDPHYDLYTIVGCGFGNSPGRIYLQGTAGAFPAHNGKLALAPVDPVRGWTDRAIIAKLDPNVTGELDQNNISLVVETSTGQHAQTNGHSFYALRGPAFALKQIPKQMVCSVNPNGDSFNGCDPGVVISEAAFISPCGLWGLNGCTAEVLRQNAIENPQHPSHDQYTVKLKPGFVLQSAMMQVAATDSSQSVYSPYAVKFSGNTVIVQTQPMCYPNSAAHTCPSPYQGAYYSLYGITLYVSGPAGITNPFADGQ
jgi:hypothetical protein